MANEQSDNDIPDSSSGRKSADGMSTKERLLAARRAAAESGAAPQSSAPPVPAARPVPSAAPRAPQPAATAPKAASSQSGAPKPAAPKPAAPESSATAKRPVQLSGAKSEERSTRREKKPVSEEVRREVDLLRKQQDKWIMYGWIVAGALLLIAGVTYFIVKGKKDTIEGIEKARVESVRTFLAEVDKCDIELLPGIDQLLKLTSDPANDPRWKTDTLNARQIVTQKIGRAMSNKQRLITLKDLTDGIASLEEFGRSASSKTSEELAKGKRRVSEYEGNSELGLENLQRVAKARVEIDRAYASKLHEEAKAAAAKGPTEARAALALYQKAEDEVTRLLDEAAKGSKKNAEQQKYFEEIFKEMIPETDALVASIFTTEVIDKTPWLDLFTGVQKDYWQHPGFTGWQLKDGVILANTDLGSKNTSIMSIGDREQWRDYVVEIEFAVVKGESTLHFRLGGSVNNKVYNEKLSTTGGNPFKAGASNLMTVTVLGSTLKIAYADPERTGGETTLGWNINRKGGIGISVPAGSEIKITKMRIKALR